MKKILVFLFLVQSSITMFGQENTNAPVIKFDVNTIDYGSLEKGADGVRYFVFTNQGKEPLIISNIRSSCGCTIPTFQKTPIGPGEESKIEVKYDTKRVGPFRKTITVYSNAKDSKNILTISGKIVSTKNS